jgi:hypothetical protein
MAQCLGSQYRPGVYGRTGKWTAVEDVKLKDAGQTHGGKDWGAITALVPGRTIKQCWGTWKNHMDPNRSTVRGKNMALSIRRLL